LYEKIDINVIGIHIQPSEVSIGFAEQMQYLHVVNTPTSVNKFRLKTFVITLVYVFTGIEVYHKLKMDGRFYMQN